MNKTAIEWTDFTWNPITGCLNGCEYCYARKLAHGRLKGRYLANKNTAPTGHNILLPNLGFIEMNPFWPRFWPERLVEPSHIKKPSRIFTCDMSDLFGIGVPEAWTAEVLHTISCYPQHTFQLLTKQPQNLIKYNPYPRNCYVGVTATNQRQYDEAVEYLQQVDAAVKFLSFEPLLSRINPVDIDLANWVIIGQQTPISPKTQPKIEWVQEIVQAADKAGVPVFLKNNLRPLIATLSAIEGMLYYDDQSCGLRQEFPKE